MQGEEYIKKQLNEAAINIFTWRISMAETSSFINLDYLTKFKNHSR